jgi:hypothetical protein
MLAYDPAVVCCIVDAMSRVLQVGERSDRQNA